MSAFEALLWVMLWAEVAALGAGLLCALFAVEWREQPRWVRDDRRRDTERLEHECLDPIRLDTCDQIEAALERIQAIRRACLAESLLVDVLRCEAVMDALVDMLVDKRRTAS